MNRHVLDKFITVVGTRREREEGSLRGRVSDINIEVIILNCAWATSRDSLERNSVVSANAFDTRRTQSTHIVRRDPSPRQKRQSAVDKYGTATGWMRERDMRWSAKGRRRA